ncbi:MAG: ribonuclease III [Clostridiales bacterium]|nr:ribonuclease III [Candidatus Equinaster intestinalis]
MDTKLLNPSVLAFVGDSVYSLLVREKFAEINRKSGDLHSLSVKFVNAAAQARAYEIIEPILTEEEISIFKRGRNYHTSSAPKNSTKGEYHTATGLEALFGYLHLSGNAKRAKELFAVIWENSPYNE